MKRILLLVPLLLPACASEDSEVCDRGFERVEQCGGTVEVQGGDVDCSGQVKCLMLCVNDAPCEDIQNSAGTDYEVCLDSCSE